MEMKNESREDTEKATEEMIEWRSMSQEEMDECWKRPAEKMEQEALDKYKVDNSNNFACRSRGSFFWVGMEACTKKQEVQDTKVGRRLLGRNFRLVQRIQPAAFEKYA